MKRTITAATLFCATLALFAGCNDSVERTFYDGPEYIMFADTLNNYYVTPDGDIAVRLATTRACDYDRTVGVEVVAKGSTAIENRHFDLVSNNIVIPAGELAGEVKLKVYYDKLEATDSLGAVLRLVASENTEWSLYGTETKVVFEKHCAFNSETWFENEKRDSDPEKYDYANYIMYATFPYSSTPAQFTKMLVKVRVDPNDNRKMLVQGPFQTGIDLRLSFEPGNPGEEYIKIIPQETFYSPDYGMITMGTAAQQVSTYNSCKRYMEFYLNCYVESLGSFGVYPYYMEWLSEHDAEEIRNNGF